MMLRFFFLTLLTMIFVGCAHPRMQLVVPGDKYYFQPIVQNTQVQVKLGEVVDKRPSEEVSGQDLKKPAGGSFLLLGWREFRRGTKYYPGRSIGPSLTEAFRSRFKDSLSQSGLHNPQGTMSYRVDAEILHYTGINYETHQGVAVLPLFGTSRVQFSKDYGLCVVLLKIYNSKGDLVGETPVSYRRSETNLRAMDVPNWDSRESSLQSLMGVTIEKSIRAIGGLLLADLSKQSPKLVNNFTGPVQNLEKDRFFLVHRVLKDRSRTEFARIHSETGKVISRYEAYYVDAGGLPGHWYLSAHTERGFRLPRTGYRDIAAKVAQSFNISRVDDIMLYRFYGIQTN
ncbi:MAG: hypothetical protein HOK28_22065 [Deltaproteobacteria bacterium]|nr:hypothetical protein [Deltaproteobacteria bacterium]